MPTKAELRAINASVKLIIVSGKDKGEKGYVAAVSPKEMKVIVLKETSNPKEPEPLNAVIKHKKARMQGERSARIKLPAPIHISNVKLLDPTTGEPTRVGRRKEENGKSVRYAKKSGNVIEAQPLPHEKNS